MEIKVVLGLNFGDEGKGMVVQNLCKQALLEGKKPLVVRFSGGPQAAHTIIHNDQVHICSSFGSGALLGIPTLYRSGCVDPISLFKEKRLLKTNPKIHVHNQVKIITPYDVLFSQNDPTTLSDGTCGKGVYATIKRCKEQYFGYLGNFRKRKDWMLYLRNVEDYYINKGYNFDVSDQIKQRFCDCVMQLDIIDSFWEIETSYDVLIFEGTQGLLLDPKTSPFKPHVTSTELLPTYGWFDDTVEYYFVTRSYLTRHGNGYEPKKCDSFYDLTKKFETNKFNQFQGEFKTGVLSLDLINRTIDRNLLDERTGKFNLVITHMDIPIEQNKFMFEQFGQIKTFEELNLEVSPEEICCYLADHINLDFDNIYYTNSPNSSLHVSHMSGCSR